MSEDISMPAARVPLVDDKGMITREWLTLLSGLFRRVGGPVGFSNSELYGDAVALQSYDELLERISSLEAHNRNLTQAVQMLALGLVPSIEANTSTTGNVFDELTVKGNTQLATDRGAVAVGVKNYAGTKKLYVEGGAQTTQETVLASAAGKVLVGMETTTNPEKLQISGGLRVDGGSALATAGGSVVLGPRTDDGLNRLQVEGAAVITDKLKALLLRSDQGLDVAGARVVSGRVPGVAAYTAYAGQTVAATYTQSQAQATDNAIKDASTKLAQVVTALRTHGLIGD